jgi:hypothetical protein
MTYRGREMADALADTLRRGLSDSLQPVTVFPVPPKTFNPPAVIVRMPDSVEPTVVAMGVDRVLVGLLCVVGLDALNQLSDLLAAVRKAVLADRGLGGVAQSVGVSLYRNFGQLAVAGADYATAEVLCEIHT